MDRMLIVGVNEMARFLGMTPAGLLRRGELPEPDFMSHSNKRILVAGDRGGVEYRVHEPPRIWGVGSPPTREEAGSGKACRLGKTPPSK